MPLCDRVGRKARRVRQEGHSDGWRQVWSAWVTAHVFRHSAACLMAESGTPMSEIAQFLGHTNSRTTEAIYARYSPEYLRKAADALEFD